MLKLCKCDRNYENRVFYAIEESLDDSGPLMFQFDDSDDLEAFFSFF